MHLDGRLVGLALVVASACGFGSGALFAKPVYASGVDWLTLLFWRFAIAAALSWAWLLLVPANRASLRRLSRRRILILVALGALYVGNSATYFAGLETVPASLAALIVYIYPALVAVLSLRFGRRLRGRRAWVALCLSMAGVILAVGGIPSDAGPRPLDLALIVVSPVIYAVWIILAARLGGERPDRETENGSAAGDAVRPGDAAAKPGAVTTDAIPPGDAEATTTPDDPDPAPAAALMTTSTAVMYLVGMLATGHSISPATVPAGAWFGLIGIAVFATALAVQAFYAGARRVGAARASLLSTVEPVYTISLAWILLGEALAPAQILGGTLIIGAVLLAESRPSAEAGAATTARAPGAPTA